MAEPKKSKIIYLPDDFDESDRALAATLIKRTIVERTRNNLDVDGKRFPNYSESYSKSFEFQLAGKSKNDPNLTLTGDMLDSIQVLNSGLGFVEIGYKEGTPENDKANWAEASDNGPARKFLGVSNDELDIIIAEVRLGKIPEEGGDSEPSVNQGIEEVNSQLNEEKKRMLKSLGLEE